MTKRNRFWNAAYSVFLALLVASALQAQSPTTDIVGRLRASGNGQIMGIRIRLVKQSGTRQVTETFSRADGQFWFRQVGAGDYAVETLETADFAATSTTVSVQPAPSMGSTVTPVFIELPTKASARSKSGVVPADVDINVPKSAFKHYRNGLKAVESKDSARAITEFHAALQDFPDYYAARIELGRELRTEKRFQEAAEALKPLSQMAPTRAEPHVEYGLVLLGLNQTKEAVSELQTAIRLEEKSWAPHYFLGLALFDSDAEASEKEFSRALELNKQKAARAHVGLAKLCLRKGQQQAALKHLDTYLELVPNAPDAETIRKFAERLRSGK